MKHLLLEKQENVNGLVRVTLSPDQFSDLISCIDNEGVLSIHSELLEAEVKDYRITIRELRQKIMLDRAVQQRMQRKTRRIIIGLLCLCLLLSYCLLRTIYLYY